MINVLTFATPWPNAKLKGAASPHLGWPKFRVSLGYLLCLILGGFLPVVGSALAGELTATLDRTEGVLGEPFVLTVVVNGSHEGDLNIPDVPGLTIRQQGISESTSYVNGHRSSELVVTYGVYPADVGDYTIPSLQLQIDGTMARTLPLRLKVQAPGSAPGGGQGGAAPNNVPAQPAPGTKKAAPKAAPNAGQANDDNAGLFMERDCDKDHAYIGEVVLCTVRFYHRGNLSGGQRVAVSSAEFRRFNLEGEKRYQKVVNGQRYMVIELKEVIIPTKAGDLEVPPFTIEARVLTTTHRGNPLDKFFDNFRGGMFNFDMSFTEEKAVTVKTPPTRLAVQALPDAGKPQNFSGLVGGFQIAAAISRNQIAAGDTATLTITIAGEGPADMMNDPPLVLDPSLKVYPDKPEYKETLSAEQGVQSNRIYRYALVPGKAGSFNLGAIDVPTFNPKLNQYVILHADLGTLIVDPAKTEAGPLVVAAPPAAGQGAAKQDVKQLAEDLLGLHRGLSAVGEQSLGGAERWWLTALGSLPWAGAAMAFAFATWRQRRGSDGDAQRRSRAYRAFAEALDHIDHGDGAGGAAGGGAASMTKVYAALRDYLGDKLAMHGRALSAREVEASLARLGAPPELTKQAATLIATVEQSEFQGRVPDHAEAVTWISAVRDLVRKVEDTCKS